MTNSNDELCMALMRADSEPEVVSLLSAAGYWSDPTAWRDLGDNENNYSSIGNQQSEAVAALIEKIVNGVDARLMNACSEAGINPESPAAPTTIRSAVSRFFEDGQDDTSEDSGRIATWPDDKATAEGRLLTLAATGFRPADGMPSITIVDQGEGQEPDRFPDSFMSLQRSNKLRVHFVQGKFNMGGTGALQFCSGEHKLQLIVSRRNPALVKDKSNPRANDWGFTVVRREWPTDGGRSSVFTYLAPVGAETDRRGAVLSFSAPTWPIFPEANKTVRDAYGRSSPYGSLVKLYEYEWQGGTRSNIVFSGGGLLQRLDLGLPELALPVRVFECREGFSGHSGSFATNVLGLTARLQKDKASNLEPEISAGSVVNLDGHKVKVRLYAFKASKAKDYRTARHGVVFSVNGQSHATFPIDFFRRKSVGMSYLADSLLVLVDCSGIDGQMREDLFMNSRDRLRDTPLARRLEKELESLLKTEPSLRALRNRRRSEELSEKLSDSKPLTNVLQDILKNLPTLAKLFLHGVKLTSPFPPANAPGDGVGGEFHGKTYPTYFRFKGLKDSDTLKRVAHLGSRTRIALETDAEDDYFMRDLDAAASRLLLIEGEKVTEIENWTLQGPRSGSASFTIVELPDGVAVGDQITYRLEITDPSRVDAFVNEVTLDVRPPSESNGGGGAAKTPTTNAGSETQGGASMLQLPNIREIVEAEWEEKEFTELTALRIINAGNEESDQTDIYDFYVNVDNKFLRIVEKESKDEPKALKAKFVYGMVLVGLAILQDSRSIVTTSDSAHEDDGSHIEKVVETTTRALAPILLPMLESIGALDMSEDD